MSAGAVIKYAMTLDGAQYMQELRKNIAETKAAEQAIKSEAQAMGVIKVSSSEMRQALASASSESGNLHGSLIALAKGASSTRLALAGVGNVLKGNVVAGFAQLSSAAKAASATMSGIGSATAASSAIVLGAAAANILAITAMYRTWKAEATSAGRWAAAQAGAKEASAQVGRQAEEASTPFRGDLERAAEESDTAATGRDLARAKANLDEKKKQLDEFFKWKAEREFRGYGKGEKEQAVSAEAQFRAEFAIAGDWVKAAAEADEKAKQGKRKAYEAMIAADKEYTEKLNEEVRRRQAEKREAEGKAAEAEYDYKLGKMTPTERLAAEEVKLKTLTGREQTPENRLAVVEQQKRVDSAKELVAAEEKLAAAVKATEDAKRKALKADWEEYAFSKKSAAEQLSDINKKIAALSAGPRTTETQGQMLDLLKKRDAIQAQMDNGEEVEADSVDGDPTPARRRRIGMGGSRATGRRRMGGSRNSQDWMRQQMKLRRDASGMEYGDTSGKAADGAVEVKGVDKTNALLGTIAERLA